MKYIVLMEVGKKQEFIFRSNKLKENIGASRIIEYLTEKFHQKICSKYEGISLMEGGGKTILEFNSEEKAKGFIEEASEKILRKFDGVACYFVSTKIDYEKDNVADKIDELYKLLGRKKGRGNVRQTSLGIEESCTSTGLVATAKIDDRYVSEEVKVKLERASKKFSKFETYEDYFVSEDDDFIKNNKSYMAVIHIDGNSMGDKFTKLSEKYKREIEKDKKNNRKYLEKMNELSKRIRETYEFVFESIIDEKVESLEKSEKVGIRPIILAGDDVTIITRADIAIEVAKDFIEGLLKEDVKIDGETIKLNAAAGIAFVKSHYPFSRAYELAEELCANCKNEIKEKGIDTSLIDWHIVQGESDKSLYEIRKEFYITEGLKLNMRPLYINSKDDEVRNLDTLNMVLKKIKNDESSRNKVKGAREAISLGKKEFEKYVGFYRLENLFDVKGELKSNKVSSIGLFEENKKETLIFFDAIELMDLV
ncbi:MAG: Cas10/Cmr2 second palm domain-containing protein [Clostridium sp.]